MGNDRVIRFLERVRVKPCFRSLDNQQWLAGSSRELWRHMRVLLHTTWILMMVLSEWMARFPATIFIAKYMHQKSRTWIKDRKSAQYGAFYYNSWDGQNFCAGIHCRIITFWSGKSSTWISRTRLWPRNANETMPMALTTAKVVTSADSPSLTTE